MKTRKVISLILAFTFAFTMCCEGVFATEIDGSDSANPDPNSGNTIQEPADQGDAGNTDPVGPTDPAGPTDPEDPDNPDNPDEPPVLNPELLPSQTTFTAKSRGTITTSVTVNNADGMTVKLLYKNGSNWVEKKKQAVSGENYIWNVTFTNEWWYETGTKWMYRLVDGQGATIATGPEMTVNTQRYYQNPSKYAQIKSENTLTGGGYNLYKGYMGLKVYKVNKYFGIGSRNWPRYTSTTVRKVKAFQKRKGLKATGNVNLQTWLAMGFSKSSWYNLGAYARPVDKDLNLASGRDDYVQAMVDAAYSYMGAPYVVGASGKKKDGCDCSGLVMQCMYAAGVSVPGINPVTHSKKGHEYESRNLYKSKKLKSVSWSNRKKGDLVFYKKGGKIIHVGLYVGNGQIIHCWPNKVMKSSATNKRWGTIAGLKRVIN